MTASHTLISISTAQDIHIHGYKWQPCPVLYVEILSLTLFCFSLLIPDESLRHMIEFLIMALLFPSSQNSPELTSGSQRHFTLTLAHQRTWLCHWEGISWVHTNIMMNIEPGRNCRYQATRESGLGAKIQSALGTFGAGNSRVPSRRASRWIGQKAGGWAGSTLSWSSRKSKDNNACYV